MKRAYFFRYILLQLLYPLGLALILCGTIAGAMGAGRYILQSYSLIAIGFLLFYVMSLLPSITSAAQKDAYEKTYNVMLWIFAGQEVFLLVSLAAITISPAMASWAFEFFVFPPVLLANLMMLGWAYYSQDKYRTNMRRVAEKMAQGSSR